jgi:hypothetical protein
MSDGHHVGDTAPVRDRQSEALLVEGEPEEDLLIAFFYLLGRDELPIGRMETIMHQHIEIMWLRSERPRFSNPHLAAWARDMVRRLRRSVTEADELGRAQYHAEERRRLDEIVERGRLAPPPTAAEKAEMDATP